MLKKHINLFIAAFSFLLFSCTEIDYKESKDGYDVYRILKGANGVPREAQSLDGACLRFDIKFDSTAMYNGNHGLPHLNKAFGFNDCGSDEFVDANSTRLGWRWYNGRLELFALTISGNVGDTVKLLDVYIGQNYQCQIDIIDSLYRYSIDGKQLANIDRGCLSTDSQKRILNPYFGNDTIVAQHEMVFYIKRY